MTADYSKYEEGPGWRRRSGAGVGTILLVAAVGVSIGLLAAPDTGIKTRRRLRKRIASLGADLGEGLEGVQELSGRARDRMRERVAAIRRREQELEEELLGDEDEDEGASALGTALAVAAGAAATYFLASERAAPARTRVRETADTVRRKATDRWERFQERRANGLGRSEGRGSETTSGIPTSDEPPLGS
ncbi:MAG TPA: YtxH domain-containing protein [Gemmatimonadales bacterium]|nr:YtxH domain-containing protein [Gemmatimonadales bacterium]